MGAVKQLIYVVDDNPDYRLLVSQVFKRFLIQYEAVFFESGTALFTYLQSEPQQVPCLFLVDGYMPEQTGIEIIRQLKQHPGWQKIPVVMISSSDSIAEQERAYASGAASYLIKSTNILSLKEQLSLVCQDSIALGCPPDGVL
ncbi:response regulator [uncultured Fibrella sp.]|uniref:response regulator n=1 Tax=uncultured Fibrella sp. TaxID=1284596 RepID=UPI0035C9882A